MFGVFIVPTGIGAEIGGHAGDANPVAKLIAAVCDKLVVHPNVVNASDLNEMTPNMLYVEGSILDRFLEGVIGLSQTHSNKILVVHNQPQNAKILNAVSAARSTIGVDVEVMELCSSLQMRAFIQDGVATGELKGVNQAIAQAQSHEFDVLVVNTPISATEKDMREYISIEGGVNLWGGIEAMLSKKMSQALDRPVIHSPAPSQEFETFWKEFVNVVVDPRKAAETMSECCLMCCLKGAHKAPRISKSPRAFWNTDIDFMISPINVFGRPHRACAKAGIPIIAVAENKTVLNDTMPPEVIIATDYLQAAGMISAMGAGVSLESVRRPLARTTVI